MPNQEIKVTDKGIFIPSNNDLIHHLTELHLRKEEFTTMFAKLGLNELSKEYSELNLSERKAMPVFFNLFSQIASLTSKIV